MPAAHAGIIYCEGLEALIVGTMGNDALRGTTGDDVIRGRGGADDIDGRGGNDVICGGNGNDRIHGGGAQTPSSVETAMACCSAVRASTRSRG